MTTVETLSSFLIDGITSLNEDIYAGIGQDTFSTVPQSMKNKSVEIVNFVNRLLKILGIDQTPIQQASGTWSSMNVLLRDISSVADLISEYMSTNWIIPMNNVQSNLSRNRNETLAVYLNRALGVGALTADANTALVTLSLIRNIPVTPSYPDANPGIPSIAALKSISNRLLSDRADLESKQSRCIDLLKLFRSEILRLDPSSKVSPSGKVATVAITDRGLDIVTFLQNINANTVSQGNVIAAVAPNQCTVSCATVGPIGMPAAAINREANIMITPLTANFTPEVDWNPTLPVTVTQFDVTGAQIGVSNFNMDLVGQTYIQYPDIQPDCTLYTVSWVSTNAPGGGSVVGNYAVSVGLSFSEDSTTDIANISWIDGNGNQQFLNQGSTWTSVYGKVRPETVRDQNFSVIGLIDNYDTFSWVFMSACMAYMTNLYGMTFLNGANFQPIVPATAMVADGPRKLLEIGGLMTNVNTNLALTFLEQRLVMARFIALCDQYLENVECLTTDGLELIDLL